jgi:CYTH domain-containing protein
MSIDLFEGPLEGLILAEAEFDDASMAAFPMPGFALREVMDCPSYSGGALVLNGLPNNC